MIPGAPLYESPEEDFRKFSGKSLGDWSGVLDKWGALEMGHIMTVKFLRDEYGVAEEWATAVSIRYQKQKYMS